MPGQPMPTHASKISAGYQCVHRSNCVWRHAPTTAARLAIPTSRPQRETSARAIITHRSTAQAIPVGGSSTAFLRGETRVQLSALRRRGPRRGHRRSAGAQPATRASDEAVPDYAQTGPRDDLPEDVDVAIIGAGLGGLCCGALLARYGVKVAVLEAHYVAGGVAHAFERDGYKFDAGPSFYSGLSDAPGQSANAMRQVLDVLGEKIERLYPYDKWTCYIPEGVFRCSTDREDYRSQLAQFGGPGAVQEFDALEKLFEPVNKLTVSAPFAAFRWDLGAAVTFARYLKGFWECGALANGGALLQKMDKMLSTMMEGVVKDPFLKRWIDLECFVITGQLADRSPIPEMAFMYKERHKEGAVLDYCHSQQYIDALTRGLRRWGGTLHLRTPVDQVMVEGGRAVGVRLRNGKEVRARKAVVTNASVWDTLSLLPEGAMPEAAAQKAAETPECKSFMHLHVGIDAAGLPPPEELGIHHLVVRDWALGVDGDRNIINISIPTTLDPSLAPPGKHAIHAYTAGNEDFAVWEGVERGTAEYEALKEERAEVLWAALEKVIPDIRARAEVSLVGTPLTHRFWNRRHRGSYGPALTQFPGPPTELPGLYACGDSTFPGIGVPSACASGMICANTLVPVWKHNQFLNDLEQVAASAPPQDRAEVAADAREEEVVKSK